MKRTIQTLLLLFFMNFSWANEGNSLDFDEKHLKKEFQQLDVLENYIKQNPETDFEKIKTQNPELLTQLNFEAKTSTAIEGAKDPLGGIPPFWWGCCLGVVGLVLVIVLTDKDKDATKKAINGMIVAYGSIALFYLIAIVVTATQPRY